MTDLPDITEDALLGGRIRIRQPARGYRVNVDTLLLAAAIEASGRDGMRIVEPCCGVGTATLAVAARAATARFVGIERDPIYAALARENVALNAQATRVEIVEADALAPSDKFGVFDAVFFNPPYDSEGDGRTPAESKRAAHVADQPIGAWIKVWCNRMSAHATLTLIHRAHRLGEILAELDGRLGGVEVLPIRPNAHAAASRVIVRARKGSRAALKLMRGLDLHPASESDDKYTPEAEAIFRGEGTLRFS